MIDSDRQLHILGPVALGSMLTGSIRDQHVDLAMKTVPGDPDGSDSHEWMQNAIKITSPHDRGYANDAMIRYSSSIEKGD
jgi:hypothetical protein